jgi:hypothetical protein
MVLYSAFNPPILLPLEVNGRREDLLVRLEDVGAVEGRSGCARRPPHPQAGAPPCLSSSR